LVEGVNFLDEHCNEQQGYNKIGGVGNGDSELFHGEMVEHELVQLEVFERHAFRYCGEELPAVFLDKDVFLFHLVDSSTGHVVQ
jgi:hypothetical protein